jgi:hypothetical protein
MVGPQLPDQEAGSPNIPLGEWGGAVAGSTSTSTDDDTLRKIPLKLTGFIWKQPNYLMLPGMSRKRKCTE